MPDLTKHQFRINYIIRAVRFHLTQRHIPMGTPRFYHGFVFILSGACIYRFDNGSVINAQEGDIIYLAKGQDYSMEVTTPHYDYLACDFELLTDHTMQSIRIHPKNPVVFEQLFQKLENAFVNSTPYNKLESMSFLYQIYMLINQSTQAQYVSGSSRARIEDIRIWIQSHLASPDMQVCKLAKQANMSEGHFRKLFYALYAITPTKYITQERISYAKKLMERPELRLEEIALQSGFSSLPYFCKIFKASTGTTPSAYRQTVAANLKREQSYF